MRGRTRPWQSRKKEDWTATDFLEEILAETDTVRSVKFEAKAGPVIESARFYGVYKAHKVGSGEKEKENSL